MKRDTEKAALILKTADICGVTPRHVRRVLNGDDAEHEILMTYLDLKEKETEAFQSAKENHLLAAVEKLVPFNSKTQKRLA